MSRKTEIRALMDCAESQDWEITRTKGDHYRWVGPEGQLIFSASTPSDHRAIKNLRARLRNGGLELPEKGV